jgi:trimethylamine--corrinoid protein Co-methyltransferase
MSGGFSVNVFTDDELYEIHLATLEVLQKTGVFVQDEEAREIFDGGGAIVDRERNVVKFPPYVVEDAIRSAPRKLIVCGRNPKNDIVLESNRIAFTNFGEAIYVDDLYTGEHRDSTKQDVADSALLIDYLDNVDIYERALASRDKPTQVMDLHNAHAALMNTTKHIFLGPGDRHQLKWIFEMLAVISGGKDKLRERPLLTFVTSPVSPLRMILEYCQIVIDGAKLGVPVDVVPNVFAGGSCPVTLAGNLVIHNADTLAGITLAQLTRKGAPVLYGASSSAMDLRMGTASVGCPELGMISAAVAGIAQYYQLPSGFIAGG